MKWLVIACFLLWARHGEGGALKCATESNNAQCPSDHQEIEPQHLDPVTPASSPSRVLPSEVECLPGSEWESNCHSCRCSTEGAAECRRLSSCNSPYTEPIRCKPNTSFVQECNTCTCLEKGEVQCTRMECIKMPARAPSKEALPMGQDCAPGSEWKSGCNDCKCSPEGLRICASIGCPEGQETEPLLRCAPHSLWKKECNTCWCTSDGRAMCTRIGCGGISSDMHFSDDESEPDSQEVQPGRLSKVPKIVDNILIGFKENDETNDDDGPAIALDEYNLTEMNLKDLDDFVDNYVETPGQYTKFYNNLEGLDVKRLKGPFTDYKIQDENNHILNNQQESKETVKIVQSDVLSEEELKVLETSYINHNKHNVRVDADLKSVNNELGELETLDGNERNNQAMHHVIKRSVCKPNQDFQNECNTCKCSATGQSYECTQNECMDKDKEDLDKEVEVFMENEGVDHIERHSVCKPSSTFFVSCNPCHCNADGTDFSCTNKPCPPPEDVEVFHELNDMKPIVPLKSEETANNKVSKTL
ncbi:uncharacterized protein isoform X1 [Choristoneura fumiferana]|uniref:uncharacterized protein isoform X1 n=1 Tax=Choristoneura fumiferana TaxID=7141 RepID=UPI003D15824F